MCPVARAPSSRKAKAYAEGNAALEKKQYTEAILATATRSRSIRGTARRDTSWPRRIRLRAIRRTPRGEYIRAAELLPDNLDAQLNAARYLLLGREFDRAKSHASRVVQIDPKNVEGHILLGSAIAGLKDLPGAMKEIEEAIELAPTSSVGYTNKAALLLAQGRKQDALANFQKAVEIDPKSLGAYLALASYHWTTGAIPEAEKAMKDALALDPAERHGQPRAGAALHEHRAGGRGRTVRQDDGQDSGHAGSRTVAGGLLPVRQPDQGRDADPRASGQRGSHRRRRPASVWPGSTTRPGTRRPPTPASTRSSPSTPMTSKRW